MLANKAYETGIMVAHMVAIEAQVVSLNKKNRLAHRVLDRNLDCDLNKVKSFFSRLKRFRLLTMRYGKTASSLRRILQLVSTLSWPL